jgi:Bbp16-like protein
VRTDTGATAGASLDGGASTAFGAQAYLHVMAPFTGTDVTVKLQDSADNATFADVASGAFAQTTAGQTWQRIALTNTATLRRYVRATTITTGGFTSASFAVVLVRNPIAGQVF